MQRIKINFHYAWFILLSCCALQGTVMGIMQNTVGLFYVAVCEDLGFEYGALALYRTIFSVSSCVFISFVPRLLGRFNARFIISTALIIHCASNLILANGNQLIHWYIAGFIQGLTSPFLITIPMALFINQWFMKKAGMALGITAASSGLFGMIATPLLTGIIQNNSWRAAYLWQGAMTLIIALPFTLFVLYRTAEEIGRMPYGKLLQDTGQKGQVFNSPNIKQPATLFEKSEHFVLWLASCIFIAVCVNSAVATTSFVPAYTNSLGLPASTGSFLAGLLLLGNTISKPFLGVLNDRWGIKRCTAVSFLAAAVAAFLLMTGFLPALYAGSFFFGLTMSGAAVVIPLITRFLFGRENYMQVFARVSLLCSLAAAAASFAIGKSYDSMGEYRPTYAVCAFLLAAALLTSQIILRKVSLVPKSKKSMALIKPK